MGLEAAVDFIDDLDQASPAPGDVLSQADDHMRFIKKALKQTFPGSGGSGFNRAIVATEDEIDVMAGITASTAELNLLTGKSLASADNVIDNFPAGTLMMFQQTAAPTGWTKQATHNNKALRVVSGAAGSGGSNAFTTVLNTSVNVSGTGLTAAQNGPHTHGVGSLSAVSNGAHTHTVVTTTGGGTPGTSDLALSAATAKGTENTSSNGAHGHSLSGLTASNGSGATHDHNFNLNVQYVDIIIAAKD